MQMIEYSILRSLNKFNTGALAAIDTYRSLLLKEVRH